MKKSEGATLVALQVSGRIFEANGKLVLNTGQLLDHLEPETVIQVGKSFYKLGARTFDYVSRNGMKSLHYYLVERMNVTPIVE